MIAWRWGFDCQFGGFLHWDEIGFGDHLRLGVVAGTVVATTTGHKGCISFCLWHIIQAEREVSLVMENVFIGAEVVA